MVIPGRQWVKTPLSNTYLCMQITLWRTYIHSWVLYVISGVNKCNPGWNSASYAATMLINMPSQVRTQQHKICYTIGTMIWVFNRGITLFSIQSKISAIVFCDLHESESEQLGKEKNECKILIAPYSSGQEYKLWPWGRHTVRLAD